MGAYYKSVLLRFLRGAVAGAVATMLVVSPTVISNFKDLQTWLTALALAGVVGGIGGLLQAIDKAFRSK